MLNCVADGATTKQKDAVWRQLTADFNAQMVGGNCRTVKQLQNAYKNYKSLARKSLAADKVGQNASAR